jgi:hypothetical protein
MATSKQEAEESFVMRSFTNCPVPYIIMAFTSRSMRWVGYEESMEEMKNSYRFKSGKFNGRVCLEKIGAI